MLVSGKLRICGLCVNAFAPVLAKTVASHLQEDSRTQRNITEGGISGTFRSNREISGVKQNKYLKERR